MQKKKRILVVSHDEAMRVFVTEVLRSNGQYETTTVENGAQGMQRAMREAPDLVIIDMMMPRLDGYHICRMLQTDTDRRIPIIMLSPQTISPASGSSDPDSDRIFAAPCDPIALVTRVDTVLRRHPPHRTMNPFVQLSGHIRLAQELHNFPQFAIGYADLDNLGAFNEMFGSTKGDQIIGQTKHIIQQALTTFGSPHDFVKHVNADDFVFVTTPERIEVVCQRIIETFDGEIPAYFDTTSPTPSDAAMENASQKSPQRHSPISISIAVVTNLRQGFIDFAEIGEVAVELRLYLKTLPGSNYYINRRHRR